MRRGRFRLISDILSAAKNPSTKTSIVYSANLSFEQAQKYLDMLEEDGLLESHSSGHKKYKITEKGRKFLKTFRNLDGLLSELDVGSR